MSTTTYSEKVIVVSVDPITRVMSYDGQLVLGARGDDCAQTVYFECPVRINEILDDLSTDAFTVYVSYKNANGEVYRQQCSKIPMDTNKIKFGWIITNNVTYKKGDVSFNLCIEKKEDGKLVAEWHTTNSLIGKVLDTVNVTNRTPEVITHDSVTYESLTTEVKALRAELADVDGYIDSEVSSTVSAEMEKVNENIEAIKTSVNEQLAVTRFSGELALEKHDEKDFTWYTPNLYDYEEFTLTFQLGNISSGNLMYLYLMTNYSTPYNNVINFTTFGEVDNAKLVIRSTKLDTNIYMLETSIYAYNTEDADFGLVNRYSKPDYSVDYIVDANSSVGYSLCVAFDEAASPTISNQRIVAK